MFRFVVLGCCLLDTGYNINCIKLWNLNKYLIIDSDLQATQAF